jgi:hypothetical protein
MKTTAENSVKQFALMCLVCSHEDTVTDTCSTVCDLLVCPELISLCRDEWSINHETGEVTSCHKR